MNVNATCNQPNQELKAVNVGMTHEMKVLRETLGQSQKELSALKQQVSALRLQRSYEQLLSAGGGGNSGNGGALLASARTPQLSSAAAAAAPPSGSGGAVATPAAAVSIPTA
jgi:hypothetical protein